MHLIKLDNNNFEKAIVEFGSTILKLSVEDFNLAIKNLSAKLAKEEIFTDPGSKNS